MDILLLVVMAALLVFMFWSSRRRAQRMKSEQEAKTRAMVPGVKVLLQGGLYGTLVEFDDEDLSKPARVELAPGVEVEVHTQAILRVVDEDEGTVTDEQYAEAEADEQEYLADVADGQISALTEDQARARAESAKTADATATAESADLGDTPHDKPRA